MTANYIAKRSLLYSVKGSSEKIPFDFCVFHPFEVQAGTVSFDIGNGVVACRYEIFGLPETISDTCYGADSIQALQLAGDVDSCLRMYRNRYDFFFLSGEQYFED